MKIEKETKRLKNLKFNYLVFVYNDSYSKNVTLPYA